MKSLSILSAGLVLLASCNLKTDDKTGKSDGQSGPPAHSGTNTATNTGLPPGAIRVKKPADQSPRGTLQVRLEVRKDRFGRTDVVATVANRSQADLQHLILKIHPTDAGGKPLDAVTCQIRGLKRGETKEGLMLYSPDAFRQAAKHTVAVDTAITWSNEDVAGQLKAELQK